MPQNAFNALQEFNPGTGKSGRFYSLAALEKAGLGKISRLPVSIRDRARVGAAQLRRQEGHRGARARARRAGSRTRKRTDEIPFVVARIVLQDLTGVPLARRSRGDARRGAAHGQESRRSSSRWCRSTSSSTTRCRSTTTARPTRSQRNMEIEFQRNRERYQFLKWGMQAFETFEVVPPGNGIVHQINLEYLARGVLGEGRRLLSRHARRHRLAHDDDQRPRRRRLGRGRHRSRSRRCSGQPMYFLTPGRRRRAPDAARLREGVTATDLVLHGHRAAAQGEGRRQVRRVLRRRRGVARRARPRDDRATWRPSTARRCGFFPVDDKTVDYLAQHRPPDEQRRRGRGLLQGAGPVRHAEEGRDRLQPGRRARSRRRSTPTRRRARSARRIASICRTLKAKFDDALRRSRSPTAATARRAELDASASPTGNGRHRRRPRRRADRRDHVVHEHVEPRRAARRGPAREESRRAGAEASSRA